MQGGIAVAGAAAALALTAGCRGPNVELVPDQEDAVVIVDGQVIEPDPGLLESDPDAQGTDPTRTIPWRYYGQLEVAALPARERLRDPDGAPRLPRRQLVSVPTPAPRWLFPFDFVIELVQLPFSGLGDRRVVLELPPDPAPIAPGEVPPDYEALRDRALTSRGER